MLCCDVALTIITGVSVYLCVSRAVGGTSLDLVMLFVCVVGINVLFTCPSQY